MAEKRENGGRKRVERDGSCKEDGPHAYCALHAYLVLNKWGGEYSSPSPPLS